MTVMVVVVLVVEPLTVIFVTIPRVGATTSLSFLHALAPAWNEPDRYARTMFYMALDG